MKSKNKKSKRKQQDTKENEGNSKSDENGEESSPKKNKAEIDSLYDCMIDYAFHYMIMADPVFTSDGFTFEKECIENWLKTHDTNPRTNSNLSNKILTPNVDLKRSIGEFLDKNTQLYENDEVYLPKEVFMEFFKDISDNNLINLKCKWLKYPDKRIFFRKFELHLNDVHGDYSIFYYASQYGTCDSTEIILDYLIRNDLTEKIIDEIPKEWRPFYLPKLVHNYLNANDDFLLPKLEILFTFNEHIKKIDKNYLIKFIRSLIDEEKIDKLKKILKIFEKLVFEKDQNGNTLLMLSVKYDKMPLITYLIEESDSNKNELNFNNENCLYFAIKNNNNTVIKFLFGNNAIKTPYLHLALQLYPFNLKLIEKIIDLDESFLNLYDENKKTLLYIACETNNLKCVELLLSRGANASMFCTENSQTILHLACRKNHKALVKIIIKHEFLIDLVDANEENSLHIAVQTKNIKYEIIEMLLNADIDFFHRNKQDKTPIDLATNEIKEFIFSVSGEVKRIKNKQNADLNKSNLNLKKKLKDFMNLTQNLRQTNESLKFKNTMLGLKCENILISGSNEILLWDLDSGKCIKEIKGHEDSIDAFKILPNGLLVSVFRNILNYEKMKFICKYFY
jgi:ankyrin repeat protein